MNLRHCISLIIATAALATGAPAFAQDAPASPEPATAAPAKTDGDIPAALRAQVLLERAWYSPGEIDGAWGRNSRQALMAFQRSHDLPETGEIDDDSMQALADDDAAVLVDYTISEEDVAGPFRKTPAKTAEKAKLKALPYQSAEEALGEKFHASPALLRKLNPGVALDAAGGTIKVPNVRDTAPLAAAAKVVVDKSDSVLRLLDADGKTYAQFPITSGSTEFPLPIGDWKIESINPDPSYSFDPKLIVGADPDEPKALLPPGPNGPVGSMWMALSKPHYGIHGTPEPGTIGRAQSSGCVRLTNWSANAVADAVDSGMTVTMQE